MGHNMCHFVPLTNTRALDIMTSKFPLCEERAKNFPARGWPENSALKAVEGHAAKWKYAEGDLLNGLGSGEKSRRTLFQQTQNPILLKESETKIWKK